MTHIVCSIYYYNDMLHIISMNGGISDISEPIDHKMLPFELLLKHMSKVIPQMIPVSSSCSELDSFVLGLLGIFLLPFYLPPSSRVILEFLFGLSRVLQFDEQFLEFWKNWSSGTFWRFLALSLSDSHSCFFLLF